MVKKLVSFDIYIKTSEQTPTHSYTAKQKVMSNDNDSAQIIFNLLDVSPSELSGVTASVMLYMQDGSFFQSSDVVIDRNTIIYTMKPEETKHSGSTKVQIVLKKGSIQTASIIYNFDIDRGLEKYPITEVMIQDWTTLTAEAKAFVEQIEGFTLEQFVENKMGQELANLEINYATRLTGLEQKDLSLTAQLADTIEQVNQAVTGVTTDSEVILARAGELTLSARLSKIDTVVSNKLDALNSDIPQNTDLNTYVTPGTSTGLANGGYSNLPAQHPVVRNFTLEVQPIFTGQNRIFFQFLTEYNNPNIRYVRKVDIANPDNITDWVNLTTPLDTSVTETKIANLAVSTAKVKDKAITNVKLADNFMTKPNLANGVDLNNIALEGRYLGLNTSTHANLPIGFEGKSFFLDVRAYGTSGGFYLQKIIEYGNVRNWKERFIYPNGSVYGEWTGNGGSITSSRFAGKVIVCFGDSITENSPTTGSYTTYLERLGATVINVGIGGTHMANHQNTAAGQVYDKLCMYQIANAINTGDFTALETAAQTLAAEYGDDNISIIARLKAIDWTSVDYIIMFYGQNDFSSGVVPIGTPTDADGTTFNGAINYTIDKISSVYPKIKISFATPFWRARILSGDGKDSDLHANVNGDYLIDFADALIERGQAHKLPVKDLYRESGINKYTTGIYQTDGLHLKSDGNELIGNAIASFIESKF